MRTNDPRCGRCVVPAVDAVSRLKKLRRAQKRDPPPQSTTADSGRTRGRTCVCICIAALRSTGCSSLDLGTTVNSRVTCTAQQHSGSHRIGRRRRRHDAPSLLHRRHVLKVVSMVYSSHVRSISPHPPPPRRLHRRSGRRRAASTRKEGRSINATTRDTIDDAERSR
jgi:hypothetical protein